MQKRDQGTPENPMRPEARTFGVVPAPSHFLPARQDAMTDDPWLVRGSVPKGPAIERSTGDADGEAEMTFTVQNWRVAID